VCGGAGLRLRQQLINVHLAKMFRPRLFPQSQSALGGNSRRRPNFQFFLDGFLRPILGSAKKEFLVFFISRVSRVPLAFASIF
jgi:hypothetical protein